jgi:hypothetical protein
MEYPIYFYCPYCSYKQAGFGVLELNLDAFPFRIGYPESPSLRVASKPGGRHPLYSLVSSYTIIARSIE